MLILLNKCKIVRDLLFPLLLMLGMVVKTTQFFIQDTSFNFLFIQ